MTTQEQILDLAQEMVQKRGFYAFSYRDIAEQVGIKSASIHYYYPTKGDLGKALVKRIIEGSARARAEIEAGEANAINRLRRFSDLFLGAFGDGDRLCPMCMLAMAQDTVPAAVRAGVKQFWTASELWVERVVSEGQKRRELVPHAQPRVVARTLVAAFEGALVAARALNDRSRFTDVVEYLLASLAPRMNRSAGAGLTEV